MEGEEDKRKREETSDATTDNKRRLPPKDDDDRDAEKESTDKRRRVTPKDDNKDGKEDNKDANEKEKSVEDRLREATTATRALLKTTTFDAAMLKRVDDFQSHVSAFHWKWEAEHKSPSDSGYWIGFGCSFYNTMHAWQGQMDMELLDAWVRERAILLAEKSFQYVFSYKMWIGSPLSKGWREKMGI